MKVTLEQVRELDRRLLHDFLSLGAWVHQYTATALYHEMQRVATESTVDPDDRPRVQMALRAKVLAEAVASLETLGRFCWAVAQRNSVSGIAAQFINVRRDAATDFFRRCRAEPEPIEALLRLPPRAEMPIDVNDFFNAATEFLGRAASAYLGEIEAEPERRMAVRAYNAIKHGSHLVANVVLLSPVPVESTAGDIVMCTHWPRLDDDLNAEVMVFVTRGMDQAAVSQDLEICRRVAVILSNLCQLLVRLIDSGALSYPAADNALQA